MRISPRSRCGTWLVSAAVWLEGRIVSRQNLLLIAVVIGAMTMVLYGARVFLWDDVDRLINARRFDSQVWKDATRFSSSKPAVRSYMVADLIASTEVLGMTSQAIDQLLGPPDDRRLEEENTSVLLYWLGPSRSFLKLDSSWLAVYINKGRVVYVRIVG
jgi:hypothetical protein